ncbi:MAG: glycosyltransferase [Candidatus Omnitrophota bacterium]
MYISENSGHHRAALAIERSLSLLDVAVQSRSVNSFNYTNPLLERIINRTYMAVIKRRPEVWEYLYDNPVVVKKSQRLKEYIHKYSSGKMQALLDDFRPDVVVCTQAFPCGIVSDMKRTSGLTVPLIGVLTDYAPHSYWVYKDVDAYIVPSEETGQKLIQNGVSDTKIRPLGIPVDPRFFTKHNREELFKKYSLNPGKPVVLVMGGGQGLGPMKKLVPLVDKSRLDLQIIVITGKNKRLYKSLANEIRYFKKKALLFEFSEKIDEFMEIASLIITKPGGLTTAEAMSKGLPMVIIHPLPGQETMNTRFLLDNGLAVKANDEKDAIVLLEELLSNEEKLNNMKTEIRKKAKYDSSLKIARFVLEAAS